MNIYISRKLLNTQDILDWAKEQGFETTLDPDEFHVTQVYCKKPVDWSSIEPSDEMILVQDDERSVERFDGGATVLEFHSDELKDRYTELGKLGIQSKYPDYRSHVTITYETDLDPHDITPYNGPLIFGPEIFKPIDPDWQQDSKEVIVEDARYDIFSQSYKQATGSSWERDKFERRARNWTFYGDDTGYVAFRTQMGGMRKLTAMAGEISGIVKGMKQLSDENVPTWGLVSEKLARASKRFGFTAPHIIGGQDAILELLKNVPPAVFGGIIPKIEPDGGVIMHYADVGSVKKYFIANQAYFDLT